jgi:Fic family protein
MDAAITIGDAGFIVLGLGLIVLVFYAVYLVKNMIVTVKSLNKILKDAEVLSEIAAKRGKDIDALIGDVVESADNISSIVKGNQSTISALTSIVNGLSSIKNLFAGDHKKTGGKDGKHTAK